MNVMFKKIIDEMISALSSQAFRSIFMAESISRHLG
jgi:hypothetical protein